MKPLEFLISREPYFQKLVELKREYALQRHDCAVLLMMARRHGWQDSTVMMRARTKWMFNAMVLADLYGLPLPRALPPHLIPGSQGGSRRGVH